MRRSLAPISLASHSVETRASMFERLPFAANANGLAARLVAVEGQWAMIVVIRAIHARDRRSGGLCWPADDGMEDAMSDPVPPAFAPLYLGRATTPPTSPEAAVLDYVPNPRPAALYL